MLGILVEGELSKRQRSKSRGEYDDEDGEGPCWTSCSLVGRPNGAGDGLEVWESRRSVGTFR